MKSYKHKYGVTLVEILVVVAIIALLTSMVIGIAGRISNQSKEQLTRNTFALLDAALEQFRDYEYNYKNPIYSEFEFPLDCNDSLNPPPDILRTTLAAEFGLPVAIEPVNPGDPINHKPEYSGSEALYFFLSRIPESRKTLDKIDSSLITDKDDRGYRMKIKIGTEYYPLLRIIDPWKKTLRYDYYDETVIPPNPDGKRTFPVITSAGPDRDFNTPDDITNRN